MRLSWRSWLRWVREAEMRPGGCPDLAEGAHGRAKGAAQGHQFGNFTGTPGDVSQQDAHAHIAPGVEGPEYAGGQVHRRMVGDGADGQEG